MTADRTVPPGISSREFVALMATLMAMTGVSIDLMLPAFDEMRQSYGLESDSAATTWVVTAYFLGMAAGQFVYGPLSDRYGRKPLLYAGLTVMAIGAAGAALSPSLAVVIACRVVWGIGGAGPRSLGLAMVRDVYSGEHMARTMSYIMTTFMIVPVLAPALGAGVTAILPWQAVFWIPAVGACAVMLWMRRLVETLSVDRRRPASPTAILVAAREVLTNRQTIGFTVALSVLFGVMTAYLASSELFIEEVFEREGQFPVVFGVLSLFLAAGSLLNARIVDRVGLRRVLWSCSIYLLVVVIVIAITTESTDGNPSFWAFAALIAGLLLVIPALFANCNTAAMLPMAHIAGTTAAVLGIVSTGGGALLGSLIDSRFDGTVAPFGRGVLVYGVIAAASVLLLGLPRPRSDMEVSRTNGRLVGAD